MSFGDRPYDMSRGSLHNLGTANPFMRLGARVVRSSYTCGDGFRLAVVGGDSPKNEESESARLSDTDRVLPRGVSPLLQLRELESLLRSTPCTSFITF